MSAQFAYCESVLLDRDAKKHEIIKACLLQQVPLRSNKRGVRLLLVGAESVGKTSAWQTLLEAKKLPRNVDIKFVQKLTGGEEVAVELWDSGAGEFEFERTARSANLKCEIVLGVLMFSFCTHTTHITVSSRTR